MKIRRLFGCLVLVLVACLVMVACQAAPSPTTPEAPESPEAAWPEILSIGCTPVGSSYYTLAVALADNWAKNLDIDVIAEASTGSGVYYELYKKGEIEFSMQNPVDAIAFYQATGPYEEEAVDLRVVMTGHKQTYGIWVREDSPIKSYEDIRGKKVACRVPPVPNIFRTCLDNLSGYGITEDDFKVIDWGSYADIKAYVAEGTVDAFHTPTNMGLAGHPTIYEISQTHKIRFLPPGDNDKSATS